MPLRAKPRVDNSALLERLAAVKPAGLSKNRWTKLALVSPSFFTDLRKGREPGVYKVERLVIVAGANLSDFWRSVEEMRGG